MRSESVKEIATALSNFQGKTTAVKKDAVNPFYKSKYASLDTIWETIRKPLSENGLSVAQTMNLIEGNSVLETTLYHTSGEWISGTQLVNPVKNDPQGLGSAITYARRYSLSAILGLVSDDDGDANTATKPTREVKTEPRPKQETTAPIKAELGISPAQTKKIYALVGEKNIPLDHARAYIKKVFHKPSTKEFTAMEASQLINDIEAGKLEEPLVKAAKDLEAVEIKE